MCMHTPTRPIDPLLGTGRSSFTPQLPAGDDAATTPPQADNEPEAAPESTTEPVCASAPAASDTVGEKFSINHDDGKGVRITGKEKLTGTYSIQFYIRDKDCNKCDGMYYTIKVEGTKEIIKGQTGKEGRTERVFSDIANDKAYLYIGHREENFEDLPTSRSGEENIYDECNLNSASIDDKTMAPIAEKKLRQIDTQRIWKPWESTSEYQNFLKSVEKKIPYFKKLAADNHGNTVGYGRYEDEFLKDGTRNPEYDRLKKLYPDAEHPISDEDTSTLLQEDLTKRGKIIAKKIFVPLHQMEYEAILDCIYNGMALHFKNGKTKENVSITGKSLAELLNAGKYNSAGNRIPEIANTAKNKKKESVWHNGVQNRRDAEKKIFFQEGYITW